MSLPPTNYDPPFRVTRASHVVLTVKDLGASRTFYSDALGLVVTEQTSDTLYLRGVEEAAHHSMVLKKTAEQPACVRIGLRVFADEDLDRAKAWFDQAGLPAAWVDVPHQERTLHVSDAVGTPLELCASMTTVPRLTVAFDQFKSGSPQRLDHFQILAPDVPRACAFYTGLGFRLSEYIAPEGSDEPLFVFLQRKGNPHDIVFANGTGPRYHHVAYCCSEVSRIIYACDVAGTLGFGRNIEHGPGRHGPGHAFFVYFRDPDSHRIELFNTHYQVMDIENQPVRWDATYTGRRAWGLPPRRQWHLDGSVFAGVECREPEHKPDPFTLEKFLAVSS